MRVAGSVVTEALSGTGCKLRSADFARPEYLLDFCGNHESGFVINEVSSRRCSCRWYDARHRNSLFTGAGMLCLTPDPTPLVPRAITEKTVADVGHLDAAIRLTFGDELFR